MSAKLIRVQNQYERIVIYKCPDDTIFHNEKDAKKYCAGLSGRVHECPQCKCTGNVNGEAVMKRIVDEEATGQRGYFASPVYREVIDYFEQLPCKLCQGTGYTKTKKVPIKSETIIGWGDE